MCEPTYGTLEYAELYLKPVYTSVRDGYGVTIYRGNTVHSDPVWFVFVDAASEHNRELARLQLLADYAETAEELDRKVREMLRHD